MIDPISIYVGYRLGKAGYNALTQEENKPDKIIFKRDGQVVAEDPFDEAVRRVRPVKSSLTDTYWHEGMEEWNLFPKAQQQELFCDKEARYLSCRSHGRPR